MKSIVLFCAAMLAVLTCNAQSVQVMKDGKLIAEFYDRDGWEFVFKEKEQDPADPYNGPEYVDLGLPSGLKWATMNVGASKPEEYGDYYAWGETETKSEYNLSTYFDSVDGSNLIFDKYDVLKKCKLDIEDDVAHVKLGGNWRMPTGDEMDELLRQCTWTWTSRNGVYGCEVTGPNGNSIFLPATGYRNNSSLVDAGSSGNYWSSSIESMNSSGTAYGLYFKSGFVCWSSDSRYDGQTVRAVCP